MCDRCDSSGGPSGALRGGSGLATGEALLDLMPEGHPSETNRHGLGGSVGDLGPGACPRALGDGLTASVHGKGGRARERVALALASVPDSPWRGRVQRFVGCCSNPCVGMTEAGAVGAVWFRCRDRLCSTCSASRARQVQARAMAATARADHLRFLTLTMAHSNTPLIDQVKRLYACFQRLRRRPEWKTHVRGGMAVLEVKLSERDGLWHPHLHVLLDGIFWHKPEIARLWHEVTGDSMIVDIRAVYSRKEAAGYVAKYGAKPPRVEEWPLDRIAEYAAAIHRRRMVLTFGTLHGVKVDGDEEIERQYVKQLHVPIAAVEERAASGCAAAGVVLRALAAQSRPYALTLERRGEDAVVCVGRATERDIRRAGAAVRVLHRHWQRCPSTFRLAGRRRAAHAPPVQKTPGGRIRASSTPPIKDWLAPDTRMI